MKAFVTSVGEKTTEACCDQLKALGFDVILLDEKEPWIEKYKKFIKAAAELKEDVLRVDADIILGRKAKLIPVITESVESAYMIQFQLFDFYRYGVYTGGPIVYKKAGLAEMVKHLDKIDKVRPETSLSRIPEINDLMVSVPVVMGTHGFFQTVDTMNEARKNKLNRGQLGEFDFNLALKLHNLSRQ